MFQFGNTTEFRNNLVSVPTTTTTGTANHLQPLLPTVKNGQKWCLSDIKDPRWELNRLPTSSGNGPGGGSLANTLENQRDPRFGPTEGFCYDQVCAGYQVPRQFVPVQENGNGRELEYQKLTRPPLRGFRDEESERSPIRGPQHQHGLDDASGHTSSEGGSSPERWEQRRSNIKDGEFSFLKGCLPSRETEHLASSILPI